MLKFCVVAIFGKMIARDEIIGQCSLGLGRMSGATLHYILAGNGECQIRDHPNIQLTKGTLVLVPAHLSHYLLSFGYAETPLPECHPAELKLAHHINRSEEGVDVHNLLALCGHITIGLRGATGLVDLIQQPMHIDIEKSSALDSAMTTMLHELANPILGSRAIIRTLLLQSMLQLFRERLIGNDPTLTWMSAIGDNSLWPSLKAMLDDPNQPHSVETLANLSGMSRSAFAKKFSDAYGHGPMYFLRQLRMNLAALLLAALLLQDTEYPVKQVAAKTGFHSRTAFTRSFEQRFGQSPRSFRAEHIKKART